MAQTSYTTTHAVTLATRARAYQLLAEFLLHCDAYNINVISIVRNADNTITITASGPIPIAADLDVFGVA